MASTLAYTAVLDACVLFLAPLRSALIELALDGFYLARWSEKIHQEWISSLARSRPDIALERLLSAKASMNEAVPDCVVTGFESIESALVLPDPNDRHVLAAAIVAQADAIVTMNLKDFPSEILNNYGIEAIHPDRFLLNQITLDPLRAIAAFKRQRLSLVNPAIGVEQFVTSFERIGLIQTVNELRSPSIFALLS